MWIVSINGQWIGEYILGVDRDAAKRFRIHDQAYRFAIMIVSNNDVEYKPTEDIHVEVY